MCTTQKDACDLQKVHTYFMHNSPFRFTDSDRLVSLSTGVSADTKDNVTCDIADKLGRDIMLRWDDAEYGQISLKKADKVKTLADMHSAFKLDDHNSAIDVHDAFYGMCSLFLGISAVYVR